MVTPGKTPAHLLQGGGLRTAAARQRPVSGYPAHRVSEEGSEKAGPLTLLCVQAKGTRASSSMSVSLGFLLTPGSPRPLPGSFCLTSSIS